jgi:hypothetical protein
MRVEDVEHLVADAVPLSLSAGPGLLPDWYMAPPMSRATTCSRARRWVLGAIVLSLVAINAVGLCVTYGIAEIAW